MNTRLQVEHPVTELVWGVDLVAMQLGEDRRLRVCRPVTRSRCGCTPRTRPPTTSRSPGVLTRFEIPAGEGIRVDAGYESGSTVSTFYDAMLAKVVCHAPTREAAARKLADTLARARIHGVVTNRDLLVAGAAVARVRRRRRSAPRSCPNWFRDGARAAPSSTSRMPWRRRSLWPSRRAPQRTVQQGIPVGWRNVPSQPQRTEFEDGSVVEWWRGRDGYVVDGCSVVDRRARRA